MKKYIFIILVLLNYNLNSQSLSIFDIDTTNFPTMKAKFFAFDKDGNQILNLSPTDFEIKEEGINRKVLNVSCPIPKPLQNVSIAMSIDVSGSMGYSNFGEIPVELGKTTAKELCNLVSMPPSEFALQTCHHQAFIIQDFTTNKSKLLSAIEPIKAGGNNNFVEQFLNKLTGLLNISKTGKHKRVAVLYTDAWWYPLTTHELQQCKDTISKYDIEFYAVIYSRPETEPYGIKSSLHELADFSGGYLFDGVTSEQAAKEIGLRLQQLSQAGEPCEIEWQSGSVCGDMITNILLRSNSMNVSTTNNYPSPILSIAKLEFDPTSVRFTNPEIDANNELKVTVTARNADFNVSNITGTNAGFEINPKSFILNSGQSIELTISYYPADSGYNFSIFELKNDFCPAKLYVTGGWTLAKQVFRTLKLLHPNGGEAFVAGSDKVITWEGIGPDEPVKIEYRLNDNYPWIKIADSAKGLSYKWRVPNTPSSKCLARVIANAKPVAYCNNSDVEICGKIWMGCNLDVVTYRNGDTIRYAKTRDEFKVACNNKEGAWCYYKDNSSNGTIYGKLYNWYAVNDPRGLAPEGWHIPTDEEWTELVNCLGGTEQAGGKLKSTGTIEEGNGLWVDPNTGATNETGFNALPGGFYANGDYAYMNKNAIWWSTLSYIRILENKTPYIIRQLPPSIESFGLSVRCIMD